MSKRWIQIGLLIASMGCAGWAHSRLPIDRTLEAGLGFVPDPDLARATSAGFAAVLADYQWLRAVQVAGGADAIDRDRAAHLGRLIDVVTTLNPHVGHPYRFAAAWLTHDEEQVREAIRLLRRATAYQPSDWRNHFHLGFAQFFYLGEHAAAADSIERAIALPGSPPYLPRLAARLKAQSGDLDVAEHFLREMLRTAWSPDDRARLQAALDEIELEHKARLLDRARDVYEKRTGRDIQAVDDLVRPPLAVLLQLPSPEPDALPAERSRGSRWTIDRKTGRIVTTYLQRRYELHYTTLDRKRLEAWQQARTSQSATREVKP